jgi:hypothetical protein
MAKMKPESKGDEKVFNSFREQGGLHFAIAMSGLAKLPVLSGLVYRGAGEAPDKIAKPGDVIPVMTVQSWTQDKGTAESFTRSGGGEVRVVYKMNTTKARNITPLKGESMASMEPEWVLLPGNSYKVDSVDKNVMFANFKVTMINCSEVS